MTPIIFCHVSKIIHLASMDTTIIVCPRATLSPEKHIFYKKKLHMYDHYISILVEKKSPPAILKIMVHCFSNVQNALF